MLAEIIMHRMGWGDVWYTDPGPLSLWRLLRNPWILFPGSFFVGVWTGPDNDMLCVKHCATQSEAELYLSPAGTTILAACLAALWKAWVCGVTSPVGVEWAADTFVSQCLSGAAGPDDISDFVDTWSLVPWRSDSRTLPEYLGFTEEEYARWVESPGILLDILRAHGWQGTTADSANEGTRQWTEKT